MVDARLARGGAGRLYDPSGIGVEQVDIAALEDEHQRIADAIDALQAMDSGAPAAELGGMVGFTSPIPITTTPATIVGFEQFFSYGGIQVDPGFGTFDLTPGVWRMCAGIRGDVSGASPNDWLALQGRIFGGPLEIILDLDVREYIRGGIFALGAAQAVLINDPVQLSFRLLGSKSMGDFVTVSSGFDFERLV